MKGTVLKAEKVKHYSAFLCAWIVCSSFDGSRQILYMNLYLQPSFFDSYLQPSWLTRQRCFYVVWVWLACC